MQTISSLSILFFDFDFSSCAVISIFHSSKRNWWTPFSLLWFFSFFFFLIFSRDSEAILCQKLPRSRQSHLCSHHVWLMDHHSFWLLLYFVIPSSSSIQRRDSVSFKTYLTLNRISMSWASIYFQQSSQFELGFWSLSISSYPSSAIFGQISSSFSLDLIKRFMTFVSYPVIQFKTTISHDQLSLHAADLLRRSPAFHFSRHVFSCVNLHISSSSLTCILHSFFRLILRPFYVIGDVFQKNKKITFRKEIYAALLEYWS